MNEQAFSVSDHTFYAQRQSLFKVEKVPFSVYCQVRIFRLSELEHISGTNVTQGL